MGVAIIRNAKHTLGRLTWVYNHNERKNINYSNKEINKEKTKYNYWLKKPENPYVKEFFLIREKYNLSGMLRKNSKAVCEYVISSTNGYFEEIGPEETKRYFEEAYNFVKEYKSLGEEYIISAVVHMDETNPHMHLTYIPVVHKINSMTGGKFDKVACSEFWSERLSYGILHDNFHEYMTSKGFVLDRGEADGVKFIPVRKLKTLTNYESQKLEFQMTKIQIVETDDIEVLKAEYKKIVHRMNNVARQYAKVKAIIENNVSKMEYLQEENNRLATEYKIEKQKNTWYRFCIEKVFECTSILFSFPIERLKSICSKFIESTKDEHKNVDTEDENTDSEKNDNKENEKQQEKILEPEKVL